MYQIEFEELGAVGNFAETNSKDKQPMDRQVSFRVFGWVRAALADSLALHPLRARNSPPPTTQSCQRTLSTP